MQWIRKYFRRWERKIALSKRQQFVIITIILTLGLIVTQMAPSDWRYPLVITFSLAAFLLTAFGLREDLAGIEWLTLLALPTLFTAAVLLFYFLLPIRWLTRLPVAALYAVGMYALLLTENIFNVAAERSIALLRAAHTIGFLLTLVTYFLLISTIFSFRLSIGWTVLFIGGISFALILQALWSVELTARVSGVVGRITAVLTLALMELVWIFEFWPVTSTLIALFLTTCVYCSVGMAQQYIGEKFYKKTAVEFGSVALIVFIILLMATRWRGFV